MKEPKENYIAIINGVAHVGLNAGKKTIINIEDIEKIKGWHWIAKQFGHLWYCIGYRHGKKIRMHRLLLDAPSHLVTDHINRDGLDNRRENLRLCTQQSNLLNRSRFSNANSFFKGVYPRGDKFYTSIRHNGVSIYGGMYPSQEEAARVYDKLAVRLRGAEILPSSLNFPESFQSLLAI